MIGAPYKGMEIIWNRGKYGLCYYNNDNSSGEAEDNEGAQTTRRMKLESGGTGRIWAALPAPSPHRPGPAEVAQKHGMFSGRPGSSVGGNKLDHGIWKYRQRGDRLGRRGVIAGAIGGKRMSGGGGGTHLEKKSTRR